MTKAIALAALSSVGAAVLLMAQSLQPLNVKTGLWQMTETVTWVGLPPQYASMMANAKPITYKSCVTNKSLLTNPWAGGSGENCDWTVLNSNGTDMELQGKSCKSRGNNDMTFQAHGKIHVVDSQNGTGLLDITLNMNGQTMKGHATYTGKWIAPTCPAGMGQE